MSPGWRRDHSVETCPGFIVLVVSLFFLGHFTAVEFMRQIMKLARSLHAGAAKQLDMLNTNKFLGLSFVKFRVP